MNFSQQCGIKKDRQFLGPNIQSQEYSYKISIQSGCIKVNYIYKTKYYQVGMDYASNIKLLLKEVASSDALNTFKTSKKNVLFFE